MSQISLFVSQELIDKFSEYGNRLFKIDFRALFDKLLHLVSVVTRIKIGTHIHRIELGLEVGSYEKEHGTHGKDQCGNALAPKRQPANDCSHGRSA